MDIQRQWVKDSLRITEESGHLPSFRDLTAFTEAQAKISNSVFGLKLFSRGGSEKLATSKGPKASAFNTNTLNTIRNAPKEAGLARTVCQYCSGSHFIYQCRNFRSLPYLEKCDVVNRLSLCELCLNPGHRTLKCSSGLICKKRACGSKTHNTTLHPPDSSKKTNHPAT